MYEDINVSGALQAPRPATEQLAEHGTDVGQSSGAGLGSGYALLRALHGVHAVVIDEATFDDRNPIMGKYEDSGINETLSTFFIQSLNCKRSFYSLDSGAVHFRVMS